MIVGYRAVLYAYGCDHFTHLLFTGESAEERAKREVESHELGGFIEPVYATP